MSRSQLKNNELRFFNIDGETQTTKVKLVPNNDVLQIEGASAGTKVKIANIAEPTETHHASTKNYVDSQIADKLNGLSWKSPVKCKTTQNLDGSFSGNVLTMTNNGQLSLDGQLVNLNDRVLVANQTNQLENGIYFCSVVGAVRVGSEAASVLTRAVDCDSADEFKSASVFIEQGTLYADTAWTQTTDSIIMNTSNIVFQQFSSTQELVGGDGITKVGNTINADVDNVSIEISGGKIAIKTGGVGTDALGSKVVTNAEIQDATILVGQLADNAVETRVLNDGSVTNAKIANLSIESGKLADDAVTSDKLANNSVLTANILDANVTSSKIQDNAIDSDKIADSSVLSAKIADGAILTSKIGDAQVSSAKIIDSNITTQKLATSSVTTTKISNENVTTEKLANVCVTTDKIANDSVSAVKLKSNSVTTDKITDSSVTELKLANNSVTTSKIGTLSSLVVSGTISATSFLASCGSGDSNDGFSLPKAKSLSIDFNTQQSIAGDDQFVTIGGDSSLSGLSFSYDDNITMAVVFSTFRISHNGTNGSTLMPNYEIAYYDNSQVLQSYNDVSGAPQDFQLYSSTAMDYQLTHQGVLGDGVTRIGSIHLRMKHNVASDTVSIKDSMQMTAIAIDDSSGNTSRTYNSGVIS